MLTMSSESITTYEAALKSMLPARCDGCPALAIFVKDAKSLDDRVENVDNENYFVVASHALRFAMEGKEPANKLEADLFKGLYKNFGDLFGITPEEVIEQKAPQNDVEIMARDLLNGLRVQSAEEFELLAGDVESKIDKCFDAKDTCGTSKRL